MDYLKNGFHLEKKVFDKDEILNVKKEIVSVFKNFCSLKLSDDEIIKYIFKKDKNIFVNCASLCQSLNNIFKLYTNKKFEKVIKKLGLRNLCMNTRPLVSFSSKDTAVNENYWKVAQHQDWPSTQGSLKGITCWLPLTNINESMGYLEVAPKTHLLGYLEHVNYKGVPVLNSKLKFNFKKIKMNVGDVLFFSNFLVHKSGQNKSKKIRLTVHFRIDDYSEKTFIERKYPKTRTDKRIDNILFPNFPNKEIIYDTFFNDNI